MAQPYNNNSFLGSLSTQTQSELRKLDQKAAKFQNLIADLSPETREMLRSRSRISTLGATTRIENAVLTDAEINWVDTILKTVTTFDVGRGVIADKISKDKERSLEEVVGCRDLLAIIFDEGDGLWPLTQSNIRGLHAALMAHYPPAFHYAGRYKVVTNQVVERNLRSGVQRIVLEPTDPGIMTDQAMSSLVEWVNETLPDHPWPIAVATEFVFRFLAIHPFQDGNGRMGRALFLLLLISGGDELWNTVTPFLSIDRFLEQNRSRYYQVLALVSGGKYRQNPQEYNFEPFLKFNLRAVRAAIENAEGQIESIQIVLQLPPAAAKILEAFRGEPGQRLSRRQVVEIVDLPVRTVARSLALLTEKNLLQKYGRGAGVAYQLVF
ncbi:MAG: Fic family protein [Deltaproteobacteria bacterium]|nr:Fic family protein [Deltaproteobacteria bacterium]